MKRKLTLALTVLLVLSLFAGCTENVRNEPTGEGRSDSLQSETSEEGCLDFAEKITMEDNYPTLEKGEDDKTSTQNKQSKPEKTKIKGPSDNYPIEHLDLDFNKYPQQKGLIKIENPIQASLFEPTFDGKSTFMTTDNFYTNNNLVLAKIENVEKLKINDRYFLKYKYKIEKVYYGNLKEGSSVDVCVKDWSEKQNLVSINKTISYDESFKHTVTFPRPNEYIITRIHTYDFETDHFANRQESFANYCNNILYKNEFKLMKENYFIESNVFSQFLFDKNKELISMGSAMDEKYKEYKKDDKTEIKKLSDVENGFIDYAFNLK